jgi:hypothetical protein
MKNIRDIKEIIMSDDFNESLILPNELESIIFGVSFNQQLILPEGLKNLDFGRVSYDIIYPDNYPFENPRKEPKIINTYYCSFNQTLILPKNIEYIKFNYNKDFMLFNSILFSNNLINKDIEIIYDEIIRFEHDETYEKPYHDYYFNLNLIDKYENIEIKNFYDHCVCKKLNYLSKKINNLSKKKNILYQFLLEEFYYITNPKKINDIIAELIDEFSHTYKKKDFTTIIIKNVTKNIINNENLLREGNEVKFINFNDIQDDIDFYSK